MTSQSAKILSSPLHLPCGRVAPNRLLKAPLEELLGRLGGSLPTDELIELYRTWARGGWGIVVTGNVIIDPTHLGSPFDTVLPLGIEHQRKSEVEERYRRYARAVKGQDQPNEHVEAPLAVVQLVHVGRQSMRGLGRAPWRQSMAPSAVPMQTSSSFVGRIFDSILFNSPREMSTEEVVMLIQQFADAAETCHRTGFDGIEIHASHGYQLAAFLSPRTNLRTDKYGGSAENRARVLLDIVDAVRLRVPASFVVGVKLNSCDYVQGGLMEQDALLNIEMLARNGGVDYVQISGGNYENFAIFSDNFDSENELSRIQGHISSSSLSSHSNLSTKAALQPVKTDHRHDTFTPRQTERTAKREAFFQAFAQRARMSVDKCDSKMVLILVGGLRTRVGMADPIAKGYVDAVGLGRLACIYPDAPKVLLNDQVADDDPASSPAPYAVGGKRTLFAWLPMTLLNAGWTTIWHGAMLSYSSRNEKPDIDAHPASLLLGIFLPTWTAQKARSFSMAMLVLVASVVLFFCGRGSQL